MDLRNDFRFFQLLSDSYTRLKGETLVPESIPASDAMQWLYNDAPFGLLAHNAAEDPVFVYANKRAQSLFGYDWTEFTSLPSRLSAEAPERQERQEFLEQVALHGFVTDYCGVRISKGGQRFRIESTTVWQLVNEHGEFRGQAAMIPYATDLPST